MYLHTVLLVSAIFCAIAQDFQSGQGSFDSQLPTTNEDAYADVPPQQDVAPPPPVPQPYGRSGSSDSICNPVTGVRARSGSIYAAALNRLGVQAGNCGGNSNRNTDQGTVNPITGVRARSGGPYERVLNGVGVAPTGQTRSGGQYSNGRGTVNPVTGVRARSGSIYERLLNGAGVRPDDQETGNNEQQYGSGRGTVNPITGVRARPGSIYETVLNGAGVRPDNQGTVNPVTGVRARPGSIYETVLNGAGVRNNGGGDQPVGLFGHLPIVQMINAQGGLLAVGDDESQFADDESQFVDEFSDFAIGDDAQWVDEGLPDFAVGDQSSDAPSTASQSALPAWAVAGIVLFAVVIVALIAVIVQLFLIIRKS